VTGRRLLHPEVVSTQTQDRELRRPVLIGFAVGFAMAFVATVLALLLPLFETLHPVLVPGAALLAPLTDRMADWNGLLNMTLGGIANGAVYAGVVAVGTLAMSAVRRRS
jgi:hypothetical protein